MEMESHWEIQEEEFLIKWVAMKLGVEAWLPF
jgi:hypothetical protein